MQSYLFYDTETTGLSLVFDQIVQFAAIRTDLSLREIGRTEIRIRLRPDVIPAPGALLTHGLSVLDLMVGECEYEAVREIHRLVNEPGTVSVGYNSLSFDDRLLRFAFYRNLLPPYTHQYAGGCGRLDLYPITAMFHLYQPDALSWPEQGGRLSLKLEHLKEANGLAAGQAHEAMADVEAALELARRLSRHEDLWRRCLSHFDRTSENRRLQQLTCRGSGRCNKAFAVSGRFGAAQNFQRPVFYLGRSEAYPKQTLWLRLDLPELAERSPEEMAGSGWVIRKMPGDDLFLLSVTAENCRLSRERLEIAQANRRWLEANPVHREAVARFCRQYRYPPIPGLDADAALYQEDFIPDGRAALAAFHEAPLSGKVRLAEKLTPPLARELACRLLGRNYGLGEYFPPYAAYLRRVSAPDGEGALQDYRGRPRPTPAQVLEEIGRIRREEGETLTAHKLEVLYELERYIQKKWTADPAYALQGSGA